MVFGYPDPSFTYDEDLHQVECVANEFGLTGDERVEWLAQKQTAVAETVVRFRAEIEAVADELIMRTSLAGDELRDILETFT